MWYMLFEELTIINFSKIINFERTRMCPVLMGWLVSFLFCSRQEDPFTPKWILGYKGLSLRIFGCGNWCFIWITVSVHFQTWLYKKIWYCSIKLDMNNTFRCIMDGFVNQIFGIHFAHIAREKYIWQLKKINEKENTIVKKKHQVT